MGFLAGCDLLVEEFFGGELISHNLNSKLGASSRRFRMENSPKNSGTNRKAKSSVIENVVQGSTKQIHDAPCKRHSDDPGCGTDRAKRTKVGPLKVSQPDSDDFVDDMPRHGLEKITKAKRVKGKYEMSDDDTVGKYIDNYVSDDVGDVDGDKDDVFPRVNTRSSASIFVKAISDMSDMKKHAIREMGLGCLLELGITSTPSKMGFWVVENFNHLDRKLQLYGGEKVHIKEDDVYVTFGLPRGDIEIKNKKNRVTSSVLDDWIGLFNVRSTRNITALKVLDKMKECADADDWFRRHIIVLMVSCLFESCPNGMANFRLVHMLDDLSTVANMNWCSYMIRCLVDSKRSWEANGKRKYTGPLLFLTLFYADKVVLSVRSVARVFPTFKSWSNESLRDRERDEIASKAFGRGFVDSDMCVNVTSPHSDKARLTYTDDATGVTDEHTVQAYVQDFASKTRSLAAIGVEILKLVEKTPQVLLGDENCIKMQDAAQKLLGLYSEAPNGNSSHPGSSQPRCTSATKRSDATNVNVNCAASQIADDAFRNDPVTLAAIDDIMKAVEQRESFLRVHNEGPSFSLGLSSDDEDANDNHDHASGEATAFVIPAVTPGVVIDQQRVETPTVVDAQLGGVDNVRGSPRPKRRIQATGAMKSPYQERAIDVVKKLDGKEKMIVNWIMKNDAADGYDYCCLVRLETYI
ncbi:E3 ubiquitin-protein ligase [Striga asiatica]|uniref:E3 ubiquitin-protein ligase n=1 Tax=Striga asiatica TaxID=4170 RepID=A0A5A7QPK5_STRAF|nr:E3 ubiquitin-protein ligase [Striga asiatica]